MGLLDRYILKQLSLTFLFSMVALTLIFLIVNYLETLDNFLDKNVRWDIIALYYIYYLPEILKILTPVALLVSTLFTIGRLSTQNEITAIKTGGISLYRIMLPLAAFSIILSFGQLYFNGWIVPKSLQNKFQIEEKYLYKRISGGPIFNLYFRDNPTTNVIIQYYDSETRTGNKTTIETYSSEKSPRLLKRIEARKIIWDSVNSDWILLAGLIRDFSKEKITMQPFDSLNSHISISHERISQLKRSPEEMNYNELKEYIDILKQGGKDVRQQMIEYYGNFAFPFANFIVVLFGVPFASVRRKGGLAVQIGAALVISFLYLVFTKISQTLGLATEIEPMLAGWGANIIFFILGIFTIFKTRT
jgi:lipopolysaccharide export system permease protein